MPFNEELAILVLTTIGAEPSLVQKRMFGGMAYMLQGNLACCVLNDDLIVRVPKDEYAAMLEQVPRPRDGLLRPSHARVGPRRPRCDGQRPRARRVGALRRVDGPRAAAKVMPQLLRLAALSARP